MGSRTTNIVFALPTCFFFSFSSGSEICTIFVIVVISFFLQNPDSEKDEGSKRGRYNDENAPPTGVWDSRQMSMSAFRPWSPGMPKDAKFREG